MKILFVSGIYPPDIGGPATYVSRMAFELKKRGHSALVLTLGERNETFRDPFLVRKVRRGRIIFLRCLRMFAAALRMAKGVDIIYATGSPWDSWIISAMTARILGKKLFLKVVGDAVWEFSQRKGLSRRLLEDFNEHREKAGVEVLKRFRNAMGGMMDLVITPSFFLKRVVQQWGIPERKIRVIFNAVEGEGTVPIPPEKRNRELITVARLVPWKGIGELIDALACLPSDIKLTIIGDGPLMGALRERVRDMKLEERVRFTGQIPKKEVFRYLTGASVFVLNSRYEGLPHSVLEAMNAGTAVVASNAGGTGEVIEDGKNGFLVPVGDKKGLVDRIKLLFQNDELRQRIVKEAQRRMESFSWKMVVSRTEEIFQEGLKG